MSNFRGTARSNYFLVKDADAFKAWVASIPSLALWEQPSLDPAVIRYAVYSECPDNGTFPTSREEDGQDVEVFYPQDLGEHLADGQVCVLMEAGAEKRCYISGWAQAFTNTCEPIWISLNDIYARAFDKFGITPGSAAY